MKIIVFLNIVEYCEITAKESSKWLVLYQRFHIVYNLMGRFIKEYPKSAMINQKTIDERYKLE